MYFKAIPNFKETRLKLLTANTVEEIESLLDLIADKFGNVEINKEVANVGIYES